MGQNLSGSLDKAAGTCEKIPFIGFKSLIFNKITIILTLKKPREVYQTSLGLGLKDFSGKL